MDPLFVIVIGFVAYKILPLPKLSLDITIYVLSFIAWIVMQVFATIVLYAPGMFETVIDKQRYANTFVPVWSLMQGFQYIMMSLPTAVKLGIDFDGRNTVTAANFLVSW